VQPAETSLCSSHLSSLAPLLQYSVSLTFALIDVLLSHIRNNQTGGEKVLVPAKHHTHAKLEGIKPKTTSN
jgi:hypothetical protein